jgi:AcrR family transcriptional regulator
LPKWVKKAADVRRGELLDAAQTLFFSKGYEATTVADIMERAGVSKGGFYHHFSTKEDLLEALATRMAAESLKHLQPIIEERGFDAVARMNAILSQSRQLKVEDAAAIRAAFDTAFKPENIVLYHRLNQAVSQVMLPLFANILQQGKAEGLFRIDDPATTAEIILQLGSSTRDAVARAIEASGTSHADEAAAALDERLRQHGIAIDRILGLPDGTIAFAEPGFSSAVMAVPTASRGSRMSHDKPN